MYIIKAAIVQKKAIVNEAYQNCIYSFNDQPPEGYVPFLR